MWSHSGHVHGGEEICHETSSEGVGLGQVNEACTDDIINFEHDDSQTKDADTQPQDQDANLPEVVVDSEDMGNNEDYQTDIDIVIINDDDGSTLTPTITKISQPDVSGDILLFSNLIKNLELSTTKKSDKVKWNGDMTELKDFVALVLKVEGTWKITRKCLLLNQSQRHCGSLGTKQKPRPYSFRELMPMISRHM